MNSNPNTRFWLVRPLPRPVTPFPSETEDSYLARLSAANQVPVHRLKAPSLWLQSEHNYVSQLSILSGQPADSLLRAIPLLGCRGPLPGDRDRRGWACRRCVAQRTGSTQLRVEVWMSKIHDQVCVPHQLWIGRGVEGPPTQLDLADLPEIVRAQIRYDRLLRRHGPVLIRHCYRYCAEFWHQLVLRQYRISDRVDRLVRLCTVTGQVRPWDPRRYAAVYPEIVESISLFASQYWRDLAQSPNPEQVEQFRSEFCRRLPQESPLRTSARPWFLRQLQATAWHIRKMTEPPRPVGRPARKRTGRAAAIPNRGANGLAS